MSHYFLKLFFDYLRCLICLKFSLSRFLILINYTCKIIYFFFVEKINLYIIALFEFRQIDK